MDQVTHFFEKVLEGLDVSDENRKAFVGLYLVLYYKASLEALMGIKASDADYLKKVREFFEGSFNALSDDERKTFEEIMAKEKGELLVDVIDNFKNNLSDDLKEKVESNLSNYLSS
jgi:succinate dehydrogenase flavin-adding protein (antitoxin of CptAB toxin-antitoxin module)